MRPTFIAEVKTMSPFGFRSGRTWDDLFSLADSVGDVISIHTDPLWGGSFDLIRKANVLTKKPILAKGIHATDEEVQEAIRAGATYVLVVGRWPMVNSIQCWIEPLTVREMRGYDPAATMVWNSRDLTTGGRKMETFDDARAAWDGRLIQASYIAAVGDVHPEADGFIVGEHLEKSAPLEDKK